MTFKEAVAATLELTGSWCPGLQALCNADKQHIAPEHSSRLTGSVDLDTTLRGKYPSEPRWDYGIGHKPNNRKDEMVYWAEIHPASDGQIKNVLAKLNWLKGWLRQSAPLLNAMHKEYVWLSSGRTSFTPSSPQQKRMALAGLRHRGRVLKILDQAAA